MTKSLRHLEKLTDGFGHSKRMPALFLGHGSPMNAIEDNEFVRGFINQGKLLDKPEAIVVVSAHWETRGTWVTAMNEPRTIHDFGGFPPELYRVQYPAPGHPRLAREITSMVEPYNIISLDDEWGLDHGSWTVVKHLFPEADIPILQLSLDYTLPPARHYALAQQLKRLRDKGVLIIGSGNMVHNLGRAAFHRINEPFAFDWAMEANEKMKQWILSHCHQNLIDIKKHGTAFDLSIPTPEHFLPLLYVLGVTDEYEQIILFNDKPLAGSLSMTSVKIG